jgi:hypothetical protein
MRFGVFYELQLLKPWVPGDEGEGIEDTRARMLASHIDAALARERDMRALPEPCRSDVNRESADQRLIDFGEAPTAPVY